MDDVIRSELRAIVGPRRATDQPEDLVAYSYDAYTKEHRPEIVLFPGTTDEVSAILKVKVYY